MRISVLDVGSRTVRLVVADADSGAPLPVHTAKWKLRLYERVRPGEPFGSGARRDLADAVAAAARTAESWGATPPLAFATACVRDAPNRAEILRAVRTRAGVRLRTLPGELEAELTFLGARRWLGWQAGPLVLLDLGGGSLEVAFGRGRLPDFAVSLPLGAHRLTHEHFPGDGPPPARAVKELRRLVRHQLRDVAARIRWEGPRSAVATSRTFQQLARLTGAAPGRHGLFVPRVLDRAGLRRARDQLARLSAADRARLPGISAPRSGQSLAGAVVGHTAMKLMGVKTATVSPWGLREGVLLRRIEDGEQWWDELDSGDGEGSRSTAALRLAST
ncbi:Ppx/GppA family phosphatase [Streptomyces sp. G45]|uniref:Ppx/GppA phosphatase family protein n=1 Tax=Streptomyces sp. G45 TaxID=3406627 RepID=UPI003C1376A2